MDTEAAAIRAFGEAFDGDPTAVASAPGRVNVVGGHTDHQDGFVLPVAIDRRTAVACRPRTGDRTGRAYATAFDETVGFDLDDLAAGDPRWADYVKGVLAELDGTVAGGAGATADAAGDLAAGTTGDPAPGPPRDRPGTLPGLDLAIAGDVPLGAGLSSSASLELAVAGAVDAAVGLDADREALALAAWRAENGFVGLSCGVMDQFAAAFGDPSGALFLDCRSREREVIPFDPGAARLVVVDTGVSHALSGEASGYNDRVADCRRAAGTLDGLLDREVTALRDVTPADLDDHADALDPTVLRRARHVVSENRRVQEAAGALRAGDYDRLGELVSASHEGYRTEFEVSFAEADGLVDLAREHPGAYGARLTGGGFGGSVLVLARAAEAPAVAADLARDYEAETGIEPTIYECAPDEGLRTNAPD